MDPYKCMYIQVNLLHMKPFRNCQEGKIGQETQETLFSRYEWEKIELKQGKYTSL